MSYYYKGKLVDNSNNWVNISEVLNVINSNHWSWTKNNRCKYLDLRIDTRDKKCLIRDRRGLDITLDELKKQ